MAIKPLDENEYGEDVEEMHDIEPLDEKAYQRPSKVARKYEEFKQATKVKIDRWKSERAEERKAEQEFARVEKAAKQQAYREAKLAAVKIKARRQAFAEVSKPTNSSSAFFGGDISLGKGMSIFPEAKKEHRVVSSFGGDPFRIATFGSSSVTPKKKKKGGKYKNTSLIHVGKVRVR